MKISSLYVSRTLFQIICHFNTQIKKYIYYVREKENMSYFTKLFRKKSKELKSNK